ncbi:VOC family protein [Steroidobacter sp. S1-65]|uniref:VOC family protein n=1 Tax=Steroidobacter gossypii TaxID=2805490 RepID=A0ABS1WXR4_9GAMM|nr:VOC family protein [Steroidobacter gossypii]MBM0105771.1 VOC family protein [Steroidobacter gossypii]
MIHHVSLGTNDVLRARRFYDPIFALLGFRMLKCDDTGVHYGTGDILFSLVVPTDKQPASAGNGAHIAFQARDRKMVDDFHAIALKHGGRSDGAPGIRPEYDAHYYGAFVLDPDGNKIEAVTYTAK